MILTTLIPVKSNFHNAKSLGSMVYKEVAWQQVLALSSHKRVSSSILSLCSACGRHIHIHNDMPNAQITSPHARHLCMQIQADTLQIHSVRTASIAFFLRLFPLFFSLFPSFNLAKHNFFAVQILTPTPKTPKFLSKDLCLQPGLEWKFLPRRAWSWQKLLPLRFRGLSFPH